MRDHRLYILYRSRVSRGARQANSEIHGRGTLLAGLRPRQVRTGRTTIKGTSMKKMDATRARQEFAETINQVAYGQHRVVVSRRGRDLAAIVTMDDLDLLQRCEGAAELKKSGSRNNGTANPKRRRAA